jgi:hypothetical protein
MFEQGGNGLVGHELFGPEFALALRADGGGLKNSFNAVATIMVLAREGMGVGHQAVTKSNRTQHAGATREQHEC